MSLRPIEICGVGLWSPGFPDVTSWREGRADPEVDMPPCSLVNARLKRGSSRFARSLGEVVEQAATGAAFDVTTVPTFYGSSLGEIVTMVTLLRMLYEEEGKLSPNRFKNSVHNAASGLVSIGSQNTGFSTAIAGGARSFETTLLEAWAYLDDVGGEAILAVADDQPPEPLDTLDDHGGLALAFALRRGEEGPAVLTEVRMSEEAPARHARVPEKLASNCASAALELFDALLAKRSGTVALSPPSGPQLVAELRVRA